MPGNSLSRSRTGLYACLALTLASAAFAFARVVGRGVHAEVPPVGLSFWRRLPGKILRYHAVHQLQNSMPKRTMYRLGAISSSPVEPTPKTSVKRALMPSSSDRFMPIRSMCQGYASGAMVSIRLTTL